MTRENEALTLIYRAVAELNEDLPDERRLVADPATPLLGEGGTLDSIELVSLVVATEELVEERFVHPVALADDRAFSQARSPFLTLGSFAAYVAGLVEGGGAE